MASGEKVSRRFLISVLVVFAAGSAILAYTFRSRSASTSEFQHQSQLAQDDAARIREQIILPAETRLSTGQNFAAALKKVGLSAEDVANASAAAQRAFNLRQVRAGNTISVKRSVEGALREIDYKIDPDRMLKIVPEIAAFPRKSQESRRRRKSPRSPGKSTTRCSTPSSKPANHRN